MNSIACESSPDSVRAMLVAIAGAVVPARGRRNAWQFGLPNGTVHDVFAVCTAGFLHLETDAGEAIGTASKEARCRWPALMWNARLPGAAKFALGRAGQLRLQAELLLDDADLEGRVRAACRGFNAAWAGEPELELATAGPAVELERLCTEAGWAFTAHSPDRLAVKLAGAATGQVVRLPEGVTVVVELLECEALAPVCRAAMAVLLLSASALVRLVRPVAVTADGITSVGLEVPLGAVPTPAAVAGALEGLSVAGGLLAEEVAALGNESCAGEFLELRDNVVQTEKKGGPYDPKISPISLV